MVQARQNSQQIRLQSAVAQNDDLKNKNYQNWFNYRHLMNKKKINIFLIPAVILLWVLIIYRIIAYTKPANPQNISNFVFNDTNPITAQKDTIVLLADYRDPFKPGPYQFRELHKTTTSKITPVIKPKIVKPVWPKIEFGGIVKKSCSETEYAVVKVNDKTELMVGKDEIEGMRIKNLTPDSIQIELQYEIRTFKKVVK